MTRKTYTTAQGKVVDLGALMLQNEQTRAVGNMNVNARGDLLDSTNRVIDKKNRQVQRHYKKQTNVTNDQQVVSSTVAAKKMQKSENTDDVLLTDLVELEEPPVDTLPIDIVLFDSPAPVDELVTESTVPSGGLAAAIARTKEIKQQLEKTQRQQAQSQPLKKI